MWRIIASKLPVRIHCQTLSWRDIVFLPVVVCCRQELFCFLFEVLSNWFVFSIEQYFAKSFVFRGLYATSSVKIRSKKFCKNLLHFLHLCVKHLVFSRDFGWRIGCRILAQVVGYPTPCARLSAFFRIFVPEGVAGLYAKKRKRQKYRLLLHESYTPHQNPTPYPSPEIVCK